MKVQCPACREIVAMDEFETSSEGLRFRCPECARLHFLPNPARLAATPAGPPPEASAAGERDARTCPKCGHGQPGGETCDRCGLNFLRFDPANLPPAPGEASRLWAELEARPRDERLHEDFLMACNQANRLDYAARQYRILGRRPELAGLVERMRARLLSLAQAQLAPGALDPAARLDPKRRSKRVWWAVLALFAAALAYFVWTSTDLLARLD